VAAFRPVRFRLRDVADFRAALPFFDVRLDLVAMWSPE
jgi:hypothetical protein